MDYTSKSTEETEELAKKFIANNPTLKLVGLIGDLGSGKTAFVKGAAKALEIEKNITSPTFVIMKNYSGPSKQLVHIDAYRLNTLEDLEALGFNEFLSAKGSMVVVEWPERVFDTYPEEMKIVNFEYINENERKISF